MDIFVNVVNQKLHITTNIKSLVAGTQKFIRFVFNLDEGWSGLFPFAQFVQDGVAYNVLLTTDTDGTKDIAYLPSEIKAGTCTLMLYGSAGEVIGTTNYITLKIDNNILISDAQSTELTDSVYQQLVELVGDYTTSIDDVKAETNQKLNTFEEEFNTQLTNFESDVNQRITTLDEDVDGRLSALEDGSAFESIIDGAVGAKIDELLNNGGLANLTVEDGSLSRSKVDAAFEATLVKADGAMQKAIYDPGGYGDLETPVDPYTFAQRQDSENITAIRTSTAFNITDGEGSPIEYNGLDAALNGVLDRAKTYTSDSLANYKPYDIQIVDELPTEGKDRTFYLIPTNNGYDKYWYILNNNEEYVWDSFGSSSTEVIAELPETGDENVDYIVGTAGNYQYFKFIDNNWELVAGGSAIIIEYAVELSGSGYSAPTIETHDIDQYREKYYLDTSTMTIYYCDGESWTLYSTLVETPVTTRDYYVKDENNTYLHFRYINDKFEQVGSSSYSRTETDTLIQNATTSIRDEMSLMASDMSDLQVALNNIGTLVEDVTISDDKTTLTITYANETSNNLILSTGMDIGAVRYNEKEDYYIRFYDSDDNELTDLAVYVPGGGGGGGGTSGGTAYITRISPSNIQNVYGDDCSIEYSFTATDSSGDLTGSGVGTLYINNIAVLTGFTVNQGNNIIEVGEYLAIGSNTVKISVSVDTGGDANTVTTKSWSVNAINMYFVWNYTDSQVNTSAVTDYYTPYGAINKTTYTFIDVDPLNFNPKIVDALPVAEEAESNVNYFVRSGNTYTHYKYDTATEAFVEANGSLLDVSQTTRSGVQQSLTIPMQEHGSHAIVRCMYGTVNGETIETDQQVHDMIFVTSGNTTPVISTSFNTASMTQYNTVQIPIVVYNPNSTTSTVYLREDDELVSTWTGVDRTVHYWNYSPTEYGTKTLTITCGSTVKTITINVERLDIDEAEVTGYDFRFKASELATNSAVQSWSAKYTPVGNHGEQTVDITFSKNFDWVNGGLHSEYDENGHLRQYFCVRAGTTMTFNYPLFGSYYDPKQYGKNFKFIFKAVNCRTYDAKVLSCMDDSANNNGVGLVMTANEAKLTTVNESLGTYYYKDTYTEFEVNIHPTNEYRYLQFWMDGSHDRNIIYSADDGMQQTSPVGITIGSPNCDVYVYMVKAYPTYLTNENELSNFIIDAPNAYEMVNRYNRNDVLSATGEIDYTNLAKNNPDLRVLLLDINRMSTGKKDNVVAYTARQIYNAGGATHCWTVNNACVTIQGTSSVGYLESAGNVDINFKNGREFTSDNETFITGQLTFDDGSTSTKGYSMTSDSIPVDYMNVKVNVASSENANNACIADWYNTYQPWKSPARKKNAKSRDTMEFHPGVIFIRDRSGDLFGDTTGYHLYGICDIGNSKKNKKVFHDTSNPIACCVEVSNNTSLPCLMSSKTYTWNSDDEATVVEDGEEQKVYEFRYVDEDNAKHVTLAKNAWDRFVAFMYDYNPNLATGNPLPEPVTFGNYTFKGSGIYDTSAYDSEEYKVAYLYGYGQPATNGFTATDYVSDISGAGVCYYYIDYNTGKLYTSDGSAWTEGASLTWTPDNNSVLRGTSISTYAGTYTHDTYEYRMAYLLNHCEEYMVMDPVIYHFVFIESFLMTDNVAKNTFWSSDDLVHWEPSKDYDNDTALGNDNVGGLSFTYGLETDDTVGSSYVFNAHDASWITFVRGLFPACQTMYRNRESAGCFNSANFLAKMKAYQDTRPERLWVADAQRKYLRPYEDNGTETYIPMLAGKKTHQREQVKSYNAYYYASKYVSDFCTSQNIMVRGNTPTSGESITVVPPANTATLSMYIDCYVVVASTSYNVVAKTRAKRGQSYVMDFSTIGSMGETELYFCSAPMITELSGLAHLYFKQNNFSMATNLQRLEIGSGIEGYSNPNLETLTIGNSRMLEYLDVRNCPNVTGALDLSGCLSLSKLYLENTNFTGITFATSGLLEVAHLPRPTSITLRELMYLKDLTIESANNLSTLRIEGCDFADTTTLTVGSTTTTQSSKDIVLSLIDSSKLLSRVRLIDVDWMLSDASVLDRLYKMSGIDDDGYNTSNSVITGKAYAPTIRQSQLDKYSAVWPYLIVSYGGIVIQYLATFVNADGTPIYDINGNAYTQWVDAGDLPYDPLTMGYDIAVHADGEPVSQGYEASANNDKYYRDDATGNIYYSDGIQWTIVDRAEVLIPTLEQTPQYTFTFSGWDSISASMSASRNIEAKYTETPRTYTVRFYRDATTVLRTITNVPYGGVVQYGSQDEICGYGTDVPSAANGYNPSAYTGLYYQNMANGTLYLSDGSNWSVLQYVGDIGMPTWTTDESAYIYRLFRGWNKSTGFISGDTDVTAVWQTCSALPAIGTDMKDMTLPQIYAVCKSGRQDTYFSPLDYTELLLGHDYNYEDIDSITIGPKFYKDSPETVLSLNGITVDKFTSGGYYFDGSNSYQSDISLFNDNDDAFTIAVDFDFTDSTAVGNLISANNASTENLRIYNSGSSAYIHWGDETNTPAIGYLKRRGIVVLRHPANSPDLYVYTIGTNTSSDSVTKYILHRTTDIENEPLCIGAVNYHTSVNQFRYAWKGHLHWMKIWHGDIGEHDAYEMALWAHEKIRLEYWGKNKYEYSDGSGNVSKASFIANNPLQYQSIGHYTSQGWENSTIRKFLRNRLYNALPNEWKVAIGEVVINATAGNNSSAIVGSHDKIYLASYRETIPNNIANTTGYNNEIGLDVDQPNIPWFATQTSSANVSPYNNASTQRIKWKGRIREYALPAGNAAAAGNYSPRAYDGKTPYLFYNSYANEPVEPCAANGTRAVPGSIWLNGSSWAYMYVSQEEIEQYGLDVRYTVSDSYGGGGWIISSGWQTRSPYISSSNNTNSFVYISDTGSSGSASNGAFGVVIGLSI